MWDLKIINLDEALNRVMGRKDMYIRWLDKFFVPETIFELKSAFENLDIAKTDAILHKLKGTAANLALTAVTEQASRLYELAKANSGFDSMKDDYQKLLETFDKSMEMYLCNKNFIDEYEYKG